MISYLKGILKAKQPPILTIEVGNIGYTIEASMQTFYQLPMLDESVCLQIHLLIKEEKPILYGFTTTEERKLFQELIKINTIGPKVALAILSTMDAIQLLKVVSEKNVGALYYIPGIGRKTAERLLLELNNRLDVWKPSTSVNNLSQASTSHVSYSIQQDATSALIALGYKHQAATQAIQAVLASTEEAKLPVEQLIRLSLNRLRKAD